MIRGIDREQVERGQVLCKPGSVKPHTKFKAEAYILTKEEGGRHTPFFTNYRPQFYFRTTDVTGVVKLPEGTEMVMPGDNVSEMTVELDRANRNGRKICVSRSAKAAAQSAPASWQKSSSKTRTPMRGDKIVPRVFGFERKVGSTSVFDVRQTLKDYANHERQEYPYSPEGV